MKVDVIIIGSGIAGLAIAAALGRQKLKALVIGPDIPASNFDFEYIFESSTITNLPDISTFDTIGLSSSTIKIDVNKTLLCVDSKSLYQRFLMSCANNGVGMMHGRAEKIVSYRKLHRVDWLPNQIGDSQLPKEELFATVVIDASGVGSPFSPKPTGFLSTYRKVIRGSGDLFEEGASYFDFSQPDGQLTGLGSFCRGFQHEDGRYFIDEMCPYSDLPISEHDLSERLLKRLALSKFTIEEEITSAYHCTPVLSKDRSAKILSFGDAASMAHPLTGEATSRVLNIAPQLAKVIAESIKKSPQEIVDLGRQNLFSPSEIRFEKAYTFVVENFLSVPDRNHFFETLSTSPDFFNALTSGNRLDHKTYLALEDFVKMAGSKTLSEQFSAFKPPEN